jgi:undecaprenyl pyrophosphate phosphatase UppP
MNTTARVLTFGVISGLIWSLMLHLIFGSTGSIREAGPVMASGILSGVIVSFALQRPLARFGRLGAFVIGLLSLPLGAFVFGFFGELMEMLPGTSTSSPQSHNPLGSGFFYAAASIFAFYLFPPAILTTFLLRTVVLWRRRPDEA